jgi:hypothetical protein
MQESPAGWDVRGTVGAHCPSDAGVRGFRLDYPIRNFGPRGEQNQTTSPDHAVNGSGRASSRVTPSPLGHEFF